MFTWQRAKFDVLRALAAPMPPVYYTASVKDYCLSWNNSLYFPIYFVQFGSLFIFGFTVLAVEDFVHSIERTLPRAHNFQGK